MNPLHFMIDKIHYLFGRPMNTHLFRISIILSSLHGPQQFRGNASPQRQFRHASHPLPGNNRHNARDDRHLNAHHLTAFTKIKIVPIVEK